MTDEMFLKALENTIEYCYDTCDDFSIGEFLDGMEIYGDAERIRCHKLIMEYEQEFTE